MTNEIISTPRSEIDATFIIKQECHPFDPSGNIYRLYQVLDNGTRQNMYIGREAAILVKKEVDAMGYRSVNISVELAV